MLLNGWIYYEKGDIILCHFCYEGLQRKGDEKEESKIIRMLNRGKHIMHRRLNKGGNK